MGFDQMPGMNIEPPAADMPELSLVALVDTVRLDLVSLDVAGTMPDASFRGRLQISDPNGSVTIEAPPEHLVDRDAGGGFGPAPMPPQPEPVPLPAEPAPTALP
jgi:hypothetical protein